MPDNAHEVSRVIAIEEHAWSPGLRAALIKFDGDDTVTKFSNSEQTNLQLLDVGEARLARMDHAGVDFQVLSITALGTEQLPTAIAVPLAHDANDFLADAVQRRPDRFAAFATLPVSAPEAAAKELQRCVTEIKLVGAMLFPRNVVDYLDHSRFRPVFEAAAELNVPLPLPTVRDACYRGFSAATNVMLSTGGWGWHAEAGLATLRLILARTFDRHPGLQLIFGHMGEMLVSFADRANALTHTSGLERSVLNCITENFYATPGGVFSHRMFRQVVDVLGPERILFAVDDL